MSYLRVKPDTRLTPYIEFFGIQSSNELSDDLTQVLPTTHLDLLIHFGDPFTHVNETEKLEPTAHLCGQRTRPYAVRATGKTGILICSLYPWAVYELTGFPMSPLTDISVEAELVFPDFGDTIERVLEAESPLEKIQVLEDYLLKRLTSQKSPARLIIDLIQQHANASIQTIAKQCGVSKRHLDRRFINEVGISPKKFAQILRLQRALAFRDSGISASVVAAQCGYYDQAHMHREFLALAGKTPGAVLSTQTTTPLQSRFNLPTAQMSRFYNTLYL